MSNFSPPERLRARAARAAATDEPRIDSQRRFWRWFTVGVFAVLAAEGALYALTYWAFFSDKP